MNTFPPLEEPCDDDLCKGTGYYEWPHVDGHMVTLKCATCNGSGLLPTEFGEVVLDFINRHVNYEIRRT